MDELPDTSPRIYKILDSLSGDINEIKTAIAVLARDVPEIHEIVKDHETRLRILEALKPYTEQINSVIAKMDSSVEKLDGRMQTVEATQNRTAWAPRLLWALVAACGTAVLEYVLAVTHVINP